MTTPHFVFNVDGLDYAEFHDIPDSRHAGFAKSAMGRVLGALHSVSCPLHPAGAVTVCITVSPQQVPQPASTSATAVSACCEEMQDHAQNVIDAASGGPTAFDSQIRVFDRVQQNYNIVIGESALASAYRDVERAPAHIARREMLDAIKRLKALATTEAQRRKAEQIDERYGGRARMEEELAAQTDAILKPKKD